MPNLFSPLQKAIMQCSGYQVIALSQLSVEDLASIASPKGVLILQINSIRRLESFSRGDQGPMLKSYEVSYALGMRYEDALEISAMSDLLDLPIAGSSPIITKHRMHLHQRSFYLMQMHAKAILRYEDRLHQSIQAVQLSFQASSNPIWITTEG